MKRVEVADLVGLLGAGLTIGGVWSLAGPAWASLAAGLPMLGLYFWREVRGARRAGASERG